MYLQLDEMKATVEGLEKERDFYFGKLRDIEVLCQEREGEEFTTGILNILYATEVRTIIFFPIVVVLCKQTVIVPDKKAFQ